MEISFTGRQIDLTDDMRDELTRKLEAALRIFVDIVRSVRIVVTRKNYLYRVEVIVKSRTQKTLTAVALGKEYHVTVKQLEKKLGQQMRRLKQKVEQHHKQPRSKSVATA